MRNRIIYIIKLISKFFIYDTSRNKLQYSFLLPYFSSFIATLLIILSYSIMNGFSSKINKIINFFDYSKIATINKNIYDLDSLKDIIDINKVFTNRFMFCSYNNSHIFTDVYLLSNYEEFKSNSEIFHLFKTENNIRKIPECIIGQQIADQLGITKGDIISLESILDFENIQIKNYPKKEFIVNNIIKTNMLNYDNRIWIKYFSNQPLISKNIFIKAPILNFDSQYFEKHLIDKEEFSIIYNNIESNEILEAIKFEQLFYIIFGLFILMGSCLMLISFNASSIIANIRLIGLFSSLGLTKNFISKTFIINSFMISILSFFSSLFAYLLILYLDNNFDLLSYFFPNDIYFNFNLYIENSTLVIIFLLNLSIMMMSTLYPIYKINKINIIECIKNED